LKITYIGPSMNPSLKAGDILKVVPYQGNKIRVGDIVVFHPPGGQSQVVHRVVSLDMRGVIRTRGDNNSNNDPCDLSVDRITGHVVSVQRGAKHIPICGGRRGSISANVRRAAKIFSRVFSNMLHPAYHYLARKGVFRKLLYPYFKPRIICYRRTNGVEMQLFVGSWVVGRRLAGQNRWRIRRPFRLFIDEKLVGDDTSL
jgi:signal peptidase